MEKKTREMPPSEEVTDRISWCHVSLPKKKMSIPSAVRTIDSQTLPFTRIHSMPRSCSSCLRYADARGKKQKQWHQNPMDSRISQGFTGDFPHFPSVFFFSASSWIFPERRKPSITGPSPPKRRPSACSGTAAAVLITEAWAPGQVIEGSTYEGFAG